MPDNNIPAKKRIKDLTLLEKIYIPEIFKGLALTLKTMFRPKFTMQYPEEKFVPPASYRGRPVLIQENNGEERCVACGLCSRVCPALAIEVQAAETDREKERYPERFEINMLRCIFCGFCEEVCPEEAIIMSKDYELAFTNREDAIYGKDKLLIPVNQLQDRIDFLRNYR
jgi:NADH-quinone oxidoreductase subunit I